MSKITDLSFIENGANTEQRFAEMVDKYLASQDSVSKTLDDGTHILIQKLTLGERGAARYVTINDEAIGWRFTLWPIANACQNEKAAGLKCSMVTLNLGESTGPLDSRDFDKLEKFLADNM